MSHSVNRTRWHVDKNVPLALIFMLLAQTMGAFWWASRVQATIDNNAIRISKLESLVLDINRLSERQVRLEVQNENVEKILTRIEEKLGK